MLNYKSVNVLAFLLCLFLPVLGYAQLGDDDTTKVIVAPKQGYTIRGTVKAKATNEPVEFANIAIPRSDIGTAADADGNFELITNSFPVDSVYIIALGYKTVKKKLDTSKHVYDFFIELESNTKRLNEVVLYAGEDPVITLLKHIIANKPKNNPARFENYSYEAYNKVEIDIINLTKKDFEQLPVPYLKNFSYIYNNLDTTGKVPFLPFYFTETMSDYYYQDKPKRTKEFIKASQIKGINNRNITTSMTKYLGNMYLPINPYDNYFLFFSKPYVSPLNNAGPSFYKYKLADTQQINGHRVITVKFKPLREGDNCFEGSFRVVDSCFAIQYIQADVPKEANINWIKNASFYKEYSQVSDTVWFCTKDYLTGELKIADEQMLKLPGMIAHRTNMYSNIKVNDPEIPGIVNSKKFKVDLVVSDTALDAGEEYWTSARHDTLSKNESAIYNMMDSLEADPKYKKFKTFMRFVVTGGVRWKWFEFGPYWSLYSSNALEGSRFRFSMGTLPKFSKDVYLNGFIAYGTRDQVFKYNVNALWLLHNQFPRTYLAASYTHDLDHTVNYYDRVTFDNIFSFAIRRPGIPQKFVFADDKRFEFFKEYSSGFSHLFTLLHKTYEPYAPLPSVAIFNDENGLPSNLVTQSEVNLRLRYAYKERFLNGNYYRTSLGSKYPIAELRIAQGFKGILNGGYDYTKLNFSVSDDIKMAPFGTLYLNVFAGKYFGTLPYPLLELHPGNENYYYNKYAFNMMNQFEFISDEYAGLNMEHSIGGGIFKLIPGVRKLKLRQFWTAKGVIGSLNDSNKLLNLNKGFTFRTLENNPYIELGTGIENIVKLLRIDFVWRVTPKTLPASGTGQVPSAFGIFGSLKLTF